MSNSKAKPGEEDLDDLDDVLDQFNKPGSLQQTTHGTFSSPSSSSLPPATSSRNDALSDEFKKQLAADMETMMRSISGETAATGSAPTLYAQESAFLEAWNKMIIQDLEGEGEGNSLDNLSGRGHNLDDVSATEQKEVTRPEKLELPGDEEDPFQKAIRQAMEKLQNSDDAMKMDSNKDGPDSLEGLLSSLGDMKLGEEDIEGGENLEAVLETMMSQLMSKDILYEPLKELDTKYPEYLAKNTGSLSPETLSRYTDQKARVSGIIAIFESPSYSEDNVTQSTEILRLMNEMQSFGSPPAEIMGPMPPGFLGADGMPNVPDGCIVI